jgi:hypothetical protein
MISAPSVGIRDYREGPRYNKSFYRDLSIRAASGDFTAAPRRETLGRFAV